MPRQNGGMKKIAGGAGTADHAISVYGGIGQQQAAGSNSNVIQQNVNGDNLSLQQGGKRRKTGKRKTTKKGKRATLKNSDKVIGYCLKCKTNRPMHKIKKTKTKNNRNALKGECHKCDTKMMKFV
jgi:hypothetical protein